MTMTTPSPAPQAAPPPPAPKPRPRVDPLDLCDKCPSRPLWAVLLTGHEHPLLFCGHHWNDHAVALIGIGADYWNLAEGA